MKKILNFKVILLLLVTFTCLSLISCENNDDESSILFPNDVEIKGNYFGTLQTRQGGKLNKYDLGFTVEDSAIIFKKLPIGEIIQATSNKALNLQLDSLATIDYSLDYKSQLSSDNTTIGLELLPKPLEFVIPINGIDKTVRVTFSANTKGTYNNGTLQLELLTQNIVVDGVPIPAYQNVNYIFPSFIKSK